MFKPNLKRNFSPSKILLFINLAIIIIIFGRGFWPGAFNHPVTQNNVAYYNGQTINFSGYVCEEVDLDYKSRRLTVCALGPVSGQVLVTTNLYPRYDYGQFIKLTGALKVPPSVSGFDYESYLARYDIYSVMYYPKIEVISGQLNLSSQIFRWLLDFKQGIKAVINSNLPEPEAGLAAALLLGYRRTVLREDLDIFARVGLSHLIAISGSHLTILGAILLNFLIMVGCRRRQAVIFVIGFFIFYPLITGLSASAVRSAIMGGLSFVAYYYQRLGSLFKILVFTAAVMLLFNARLLRDDLGWQLSFLSILGIIYLYPLGQEYCLRKLEKIRIRNWLKKKIANILEVINLSLASQIIILPVVLINFKQLSLIAPLANVLVIWVFAPLLLSLILAISLTTIFNFLGVLFFTPSFLLLKYIFVASNFLAAGKYSSLAINNFTWRQGSVYFLFLIFLYWYINSKRSK